MSRQTRPVAAGRRNTSLARCILLVSRSLVGDDDNFRTGGKAEATVSYKISVNC